MFIVQVHKNKLKGLYDKSFVRNYSFLKKWYIFRAGQRFFKTFVILCCATKRLRWAASLRLNVNLFARLSHFLRLWMNLPIWNQTRSPSSALTRWFVTEISFFSLLSLPFCEWAAREQFKQHKVGRFVRVLGLCFVRVCVRVCQEFLLRWLAAGFSQHLSFFFSAASRPSWGKSAGGWQRGKNSLPLSFFFFFLLLCFSDFLIGSSALCEIFLFFVSAAPGASDQKSDGEGQRTKFSSTLRLLTRRLTSSRRLHHASVWSF